MSLRRAGGCGPPTAAGSICPVGTPEPTCWTAIRAAAAGDPAARDHFARAYAPTVRGYLAARWRAQPHIPLDDAVQDVFVECFKAGGVLDRADADRPGGFRAFLCGVVRHVALRYETRRSPEPLPEQVPADDPSLSAAFDRAWAVALLREAARVQEEDARRRGPAAVRRVELLRLRFHDGRPIREIAARWGEDPARLHHEYAAARAEFRAALRRVVAFHQPAADPDRACEELLGLVG